MTRLNWNTPGTNFYNVGVDRGVLYADVNRGVPWKGLVSVTESPNGGEAKATYQDGVKINNRAAPDEFEATLEAYFSPPEFDACDGTASLVDGLYATHQIRRPFGLSYRSRIGNDVDGTDHAYKIHIIYNALATPTEHTNATVGESIELSTLSWKLTARPVRYPGIRPTAHFIIDTRMAWSGAIAEIEDLLYGSDEQDPRLPTIAELITMLQNTSIFGASSLGNGQYEAVGLHVTDNGDGTFALDDIAVTDNGDNTFSIL